MASNINADTTTGLQLTSDTSGEVKIQSAGADIVTVDSSGITMASGKTIPAASLTGALPAIDGSALTGISSYTDADALTLFNASGSAPVFAPRAWLTFNGGTGTDSIIDSGNISSVTDNGTGLTTVNFATSLPNANYAVAGITTAYSSLGPNENIAFSSAGASGSQTPTTKTTSAVQVVYGHANTAAKADIAYMCLIFIG